MPGPPCWIKARTFHIRFPVDGSAYQGSRMSFKRAALFVILSLSPRRGRFDATATRHDAFSFGVVRNLGRGVETTGPLAPADAIPSPANHAMGNKLLDAVASLHCLVAFGWLLPYPRLTLR